MQFQGLQTQIIERLGKLYERAGREHETVALWQSYLAKAPGDWRIRSQLIQWHLRHQQATEAETQIARLPKQPAELARVRLALRGCVAVLRERWAAALEDLAASYQMGYRDPLQLHGFSVALLATGQLEPAESILVELLQIEPQHPHAAKNLELVRRLKK
jgi:Flp pilus assembly protein TadD